MMYFSRIQLKADAAKGHAFWQDITNAYRGHQQVWRFFDDDPDRTRDFLFRMETTERGPLIYTVSKRRPEPDPHVWKKEVKGYDPQLSDGQSLAFSLRANPTIRRSKFHGGDGKRHDIVMDAKTRLSEEGIPREKWPSEPEIVHEACLAWLDARGNSNGFELMPRSFRADGHVQLRFHKPKTDRTVSLTSVDMSGVLQVRSVEGFRKALCEGIGSAKAFGFGMLMVRPV